MGKRIYGAFHEPVQGGGLQEFSEFSWPHPEFDPNVVSAWTDMFRRIDTQLQASAVISGVGLKVGILGKPVTTWAFKGSIPMSYPKMTKIEGAAAFESDAHGESASFKVVGNVACNLNLAGDLMDAYSLDQFKEPGYVRQVEHGIMGLR
jgi:hypothetical protein